MDTYDAKILADSISPDGVRLITVQATFPRFILAEVNTHRVFGRNSASSRAIPTEKLVERVLANPFVPETFGQRVKGMGYGEGLEPEKQKQAREYWLLCVKHVVRAAQGFVELDIDKSRANRILEPFMWHTAIITSTEWDNFFALRQPDNDDPVPQASFPAQPEFQIVARMMRDAIRASEPEQLGHGDWGHLPLVTEDEKFEADDDRVMDRGDRTVPDRSDGLPWVSAGRCARVSFDTHENWEEQEVSYGRAKTLKTNGHMSPFEHVARPISPEDMDPETGGDLQNKLMIPLASAKRATHSGLRAGDVWCGNVRGWVQLRKLIPNENNFGEIIAGN